MQRRGAFVQPLLQWKSNEYCTIWKLCICSLRYSACSAQAPYCHLWPAPLYCIILPLLINGTMFEKSYWIQNVYFDFLYKFIWNSVDKKKQLDVTFVFFISLLLVARHVSGTWLPETCWATIRREMKNTKSDIYFVILIHTKLRCTVNHTSDLYETILILRRNEPRYKNVYWSSCKVSFILVRF